ncbi:orotidine 5'-phosphate decarboxylase / HUMPS family protein [Enterococcus pallens]|uniref:3-hexulose-6-phosphate synthase n=1 Tax=Enterococcus pallens ATCC BAA-351 TaxID=1158607 RepID=R2SJU2_9ENTE|nr:orotidine 5'-phosphate decarboxylase / HUMPS family protein [Enterococcus pallens]EOH93186.1 3-hexulose-6-phosphate synthase [Enterococcus pallens ATCC BAA-351]EOU24972.1 3-hexulose-6-phosphate synthase [Enterococcus pallens ATCC BAA-351]
MKLQTAIDRISLEEAVKLAQALNGKTDILEMGTSLVKDYGNLAIEQIRAVLPDTELLVDLKTIDEGAYEFRQGYRYGGDILTVMGAASYDTLQACYEVAQEQQKTMMIDLLEVTDEKVAQLTAFDQAIFALHHSIDRKDKLDAVASVKTFHQQFPTIKRLAIAGGIDLKQAKGLAEQGLTEIVIVGSKITKAEEPLQAVQQFMEGIQ